MNYHDQETKPRLRQPEDHGRWDGSTFIFVPAIEVALDTVVQVERVNLSHVSIYDLDPREVVLALLNPSERPYERELREIALGR